MQVERSSSACIVAHDATIAVCQAHTYICKQLSSLLLIHLHTTMQSLSSVYKGSTFGHMIFHRSTQLIAVPAGFSPCTLRVEKVHSSPAPRVTTVSCYCCTATGRVLPMSSRTSASQGGLASARSAAGPSCSKLALAALGASLSP